MREPAAFATSPRRVLRHRRAAGFAAASVLFAVALFVILGAASATIARGNAQARLFQETREQMVAQRDLILNTLILCRTIYPAGDNGNTVRQQYPATPGDGLVASLVCPGQSPASIWSGDARALAPRPLPGFSAWTYVNDATSIRIATTAANSGSQFYRDLMDSTINKVGGTQASRSGDTLTITLIN